MYIENVPNRSSPPCTLLRESYRQGRKVKKRTLANLTHWPPDVVEGLRRLLEGQTPADQPDGFEITRSLPHGHVAAVLQTLRKLGLHKIIARKHSRKRDLVEALIVARIIDPRSKLATARGISQETAFTSLGEMLQISDCNENDFYAAMDWLLPRQQAIEEALAKRHLQDGMLVLYDVTSAYFEGHCCPLAQYGYPHGGPKDKLQIVFGLLCDVEGRPVATEVFAGDVGDPSTLASQIDKIRRRFGIQRVVLVGDRGMITEARLREDLAPVEGLDWITALRAPAIRGLIKEGSLQPSLFDQQDLAEIHSPAYPDERLVVCYNPVLAAERRQRRNELLAATEKELDKIVVAVQRRRRPLRGVDKIALRVGKVHNRFKMRKHFKIEIEDNSFRYERNAERIVEEAALDGFYVVRTSVPRECLDAEGTVRAYKGLSQVERAFRCLKTVDLKVRPIHHRLADRVRTHVFLCMLAYYVEWHMRQALAPLLFDDEDKATAEAMRPSVVAPAKRSPAAEAKAASKRTTDGGPVHSFQTLLADLATITKNRIQPNLPGAGSFEKITQAQPHQHRALELLGVHV